MSGEYVWHGADASVLSWLQGISTEGELAGYGVGAMPDKVFVLPSLFERLDGKPLMDGGPVHTAGTEALGPR